MKIRNIALSLALLQAVAFAEVSLSLNMVKNDSVSQGDWKYFMINGGASSIKLFNLSSDLDLHIKSGSRPTADNWDCRPYAGGTEDEVCSVSPNEVIYIGVHGFTSGSFSLVANGSDGGGVTPQPDTPTPTGDLLLYENDSVSQGGWKYYTINGGATAVKLYNLSSDLDLHVKSGSRPTEDNWDCRPYAGGTTEEVCQVNPNEVIYIGVHGYTSGSFTLDVEGNGGGGGSVTPDPDPGTPTQPVGSILHTNESVTQGAWKYHTINGGATGVKIFNLSSDVDLYVKSGARPTADNWDCRPYAGGTTEEECSVSPNEVVYIGIYGYTSASYTLDVQGSGTPNPDPGSTVATQASNNAVANLGKLRGQVSWNGTSQTGTWADSQYTYCARFVRMCFGEPGKYSSAIAMYNHFNDLRLIQSYGTPPKGAVLFYAADNENRYYGHTGIADGNGYIYSATSHWRGITKLRTHAFAARYLGYVTAELFKQNH